MTLSKLSRLGRVQYALALLTALAASGAVRAHAASSCVIGYPFKSSDPRTDVSFNESEVLRAFSPQQTVNATPGLSIKVWYNDEHALTLGVRRVIVLTKTGTTTTDYSVSALSTDPGSVLDPQVGTTALDGDQAGTDTSACTGYPDLCDRPMFPALFLTDISTDPNSTAERWHTAPTQRRLRHVEGRRPHRRQDEVPGRYHRHTRQRPGEERLEPRRRGPRSLRSA